MSPLTICLRKEVLSMVKSWLTMLQRCISQEQNLNKLDEEADLFNAILEACDDGILISDVHGMVVFVNKAYVRVTGIQKEQIVGKNLKELLEEGLFNIAVSLMVIEQGTSISKIHKYATGKKALTTANPIIDTQNQMVGVLNSTRDISSLIQMKNELEETQKISKKYVEELRHLRQLQMQKDGFIFRSKAMVNMIDLATKAAGYDSNILIYGESGTGKELLSSFIHNHSPRKDGPYIVVNCAAIPNELFESELFGYLPGSFTGALQQGKSGMFELADGGTIFLDEVSELPLPVQSKLLRVIQERELFRIGASKPTKIDIRIIAATNKALLNEVKMGKFREDLYFRLNVFPIKTPPLRERKEDIEDLVLFFLERLNKRYKKNVNITREAVECLKSYSWPGNVRELQNLIEYMFIINPFEEIDIEQLPTHFFTEHLLEKEDVKDPKASKLNHIMDHFEKKVILSTLKSYQSIRKAAEVLEVNPSTLSRKIKKYGIDHDIN